MSERTHSTRPCMAAFISAVKPWQFLLSMSNPEYCDECCVSLAVLPVDVQMRTLSQRYDDVHEALVTCNQQPCLRRKEKGQRLRAFRRRAALRVRERIIRRVEGVVRRDSPTVLQVLKVNFFEFIVVFLPSVVLLLFLLTRAQIVLVVRVGPRLLDGSRVDLGDASPNCGGVSPGFVLLMELFNPDRRDASSIPVVRDQHHLTPEPRALSSGQSAAWHAGRWHGTARLSRQERNQTYRNLP
ncbi:hypothetical protein EYF80_005059 [Liparis tanakae]|uniref:Uncharacterized protein n=1 Tax=Liparis tanakae TaxID=230148 RepID=A0A4Z2J430_9TELE|nr:hypothetical protein EYF80_005059 [Liparis tanakae]